MPAPQAPKPGYTVENGVLTSATYAGVAGRDYAVYDMISREATAKSNYITFDADWKINDSLKSSAPGWEPPKVRARRSASSSPK